MEQVNRQPEKAALRAFAKIMGRRRGGLWIPVDDPRRAGQIKAKLKKAGK